MELGVARSENLCDKIHCVRYHDSLKVFIAATDQQKLKIIDPCGSRPSITVPLPGNDTSHVHCLPLHGRKGLWLSNGTILCYRRTADTNHGTLFLSSALQRARAAEDKVILEMTNQEAELILSTAGLIEFGNSKEFISALIDNLFEVHNILSGNSDVAKWTAVKVEASFDTLHCALRDIKQKLLAGGHAKPAMHTLATLSDRLHELAAGDLRDGFGSSSPNYVAPEAPVKWHMKSEALRLLSFDDRWPHPDYEWATPAALAKAGFYFSPTEKSLDGTTCFACGLCAHNWEPEDEPWSEHWRHNQTCPMIASKPCQNEPLAFSIELKHNIISHGKDNEMDVVAIYSPISNTVSILGMEAQLQELSEFEVCDFDELIWEAVLDNASEEPQEAHEITCTVTALAICEMPSEHQSGTSKTEPGIVCGAVVMRKGGHKMPCLVSFGWTRAPPYDWDMNGVVQEIIKSHAIKHPKDSVNPLLLFDPNNPFAFIEEAYALDVEPNNHGATLPKKATSKPVPAMRSTVAKCIPVKAGENTPPALEITLIQPCAESCCLVAVATSMADDTALTDPSNATATTAQPPVVHKSLILCYRCDICATESNLEEVRVPLINGHASTIVLRDVPARRVWCPVEEKAAPLAVDGKVVAICLLPPELSSCDKQTFHFALLTSGGDVMIFAGPQLRRVACCNSIATTIAPPYNLTYCPGTRQLCVSHNEHLIYYQVDLAGKSILQTSP